MGARAAARTGRRVRGGVSVLGTWPVGGAAGRIAPAAGLEADCRWHEDLQPFPVDGVRPAVIRQNLLEGFSQNWHYTFINCGWAKRKRMWAVCDTQSLLGHLALEIVYSLSGKA